MDGHPLTPRANQAATHDDKETQHMTDSTTPEDAHVRPFADWLRDQGAGRLHDELSDRLHQVIAAVQETGKGGQLVLKVEFKPIPNTGGRTLTVTDSVAAKIPAADRPKSIFFIDDGGNLSRNDPTQPVITGLREVDAPANTTLRSAQ